MDAKLIISVAALVVSVGVGVIAYWQYRNANAKLKLDLYEKRFGVYVSVLDFFQSCTRDQADVKMIEEKYFVFIKSYRESKFLFAKRDGIYSILTEVKDVGHRVLEDKRGYYDSEKYKNYYGQLSTEEKVKASETRASGLTDLMSCLTELEDKISKYIHFQSVKGW